MIISDGRKIKVYNGTVDTISANKVVIVKGKQIILASNTDINATRYPLGYTLSSINIGEYGEVLVEGSIQNINSSSYGFQGTILYLSTNGNITTTRPSTAIVIGSTITNDLVSGSIYFKCIIDDKVPYTGATADVNLGEYELKAGQIEFDQTPTGTAGVGIMRWNDADGTVDLGMKGGSVTLQIGQEQLTRIVNKTEIDLLEANYQAVKISGAQGNRLKVDLAQANNDANSAETLGIVTETILKNDEGFITTSGLVRNINTTGTLQGETWLDGDMLYLSGTVAGQLTNVKPSAPTHTVIMGYVVRAHGTQGQIYVKVDNGYELDELHNVRIVEPATNQVLIYDADSRLWRNSDMPSASATWGGITGTLSDQSDLQTELDNKQDAITLTTTGTSGAATLIGNTLNIPEYSGGSGGSSFPSGITVTPPTGSGTDKVGIAVSGTNTNGGSNYVDFLKATNTTSGATNINKFFRLNVTGQLEIVNSAYSAIIMTLTDSGLLNGATQTEMSYLSGVTSNIQTQLNSKIGTSKSFMHGLHGATVGAATTTYAIFGVTSFNAERARIFVVPADCTVKNFNVRIFAAQPATGSLVLTIRKNSADTAIVVTIAAGSALDTEANSGSLSDTFAARDDMSIKLVNNATTTSATVHNTSIMVEI